MWEDFDNLYERVNLPDDLPYNLEVESAYFKIANFRTKSYRDFAQTFHLHCIKGEAESLSAYFIKALRSREEAFISQLEV